MGCGRPILASSVFSGWGTFDGVAVDERRGREISRDFGRWRRRVVEQDKVADERHPQVAEGERAIRPNCTWEGQE